MPTFVLRLIAPRPNFAQTMTDAEREIMNRHAAHWRPYLERGDMVVFGPILTDDDSYGLAVVETDDEQALRDFAAQDPVVTTGAAVWNDTRNGQDCPAVDTYRENLQLGITPNPAPNPPTSCGATSTFGNSDIYSFSSAP